MPETPPLRWIGDQSARSLLSLPDAIDVLAAAHAAYARGDAGNMRRAHLLWEDSILHAVGGVVDDVAGTKSWVYTPRGATPVIVLLSLADGAVIGLIEAFALGQLRTAATTGLGTRLLARDDADVLALLGTGRQALEQARAVAAVRPLREVRVFGRDRDRRAQMVARIDEELGVRTVGHGDVAAALRGASVVATMTRAAEPIVSGAMLEPGMHVTAAGAIVPSRRELDVAAVARCDVIVADSRPQAEHDSGELRAAADAGAVRWDAVLELGELVAGSPGRRDPEDITLFKALGVGLADVALGIEVLRRAQVAELPQTTLSQGGSR